MKSAGASRLFSAVGVALESRCSALYPSHTLGLSLLVTVASHIKAFAFEATNPICSDARICPLGISRLEIPTGIMHHKMGHLALD